jgi:RNA polymerase sigma factor FliA
MVVEMDVELSGGEPRAAAATRCPDGPEVLARFNAELDLVDLIARQVSKSVGRGVEFDDLLSAGREGLLDAARRFDPARAIPFRAYANLRIRGAMIDGVRRMSALPRRAYERLAALAAAQRVEEGTLEPVFANQAMTAGEAEAAFTDQLALAATACALSNVAHLVDGNVYEVADDSEAETPEDRLQRAELLARIDEALKEFSQVREATVIRLIYFEGLSMEAAGREMQLDKSWVSRLHARAMDRLIKRMKILV